MSTQHSTLANSQCISPYLQTTCRTLVVNLSEGNTKALLAMTTGGSTKDEELDEEQQRLEETNTLLL